MTEIEDIKEKLTTFKGFREITKDEISSLITTIESQKEEIEKLNGIIRTLGLSLQNAVPTACKHGYTNLYCSQCAGEGANE